MGHANTAYKLLVTKSKKEAETLARGLDNKNQDRQRLTDRIMKEVEKRIDKKQKIVFEGDKDWPIGVVGLIAGRLREKYCRPVIIFQEMESETKGSARSISTFNIVEAISQCKDLLEDFGGHPQAAGFTVPNKNLKKFEQKLLKIADKQIKQKDLISILGVDSEIESEELNFKAYEEIQKFAPFGEENPRPLFLMKDLIVSNFKAVGSNCSHLKMYLTKDSKGFQAIGFGLGDFCDRIKQGDKVNVVFELITDEWNGARELQLKIIDLKKV